MNLVYRLQHKDYLKQQLYQASKNKSIQKRKVRSWMLLSIAGLIMSVVLYDSESSLMFCFSACITTLTIVFYSVYFKNRFKQHYIKFISETYRKRFGKESNITFEASFIASIDMIAEAKINYSVFEEIIEISTHFFIKMETGGSLIIPKNAVQNLKKLNTLLQDLAKELKIEYTVELNWKW